MPVGGSAGMGGSGMGGSGMAGAGMAGAGMAGAGMGGAGMGGAGMAGSGNMPGPDAVDYRFDEVIDGELSSDPETPTAVALVTGVNRIAGSVSRSNGDIRDYATFSLGPDQQLVALRVVTYQQPQAQPANRGFHSLVAGATSIVPGPETAGALLGGRVLDGVDVGNDVLPALAAADLSLAGEGGGKGFAAPLGQGQYTYGIQQTGDEISEYEIEFVVEPIANSYDEAVAGDLSSNEAQPTVVPLQTGVNRIAGSVSASTEDIRDYFTFTLGEDQQLAGLRLLTYQQPDGGEGNTGFHSLVDELTSVVPAAGTADDLLGGRVVNAVDVGNDLLADLAAGTVEGIQSAGRGFTAPLGAGPYTYGIQQTGPQISEYVLEFVVQPVASTYDEAEAGDLSSSNEAPTAVELGLGVNRVVGSVSASTNDIRDYLTFTVPENLQLSALRLVSYQQPGGSDGNRGFHAIIGGGRSLVPGQDTNLDFLGGHVIDPPDVGTDLLPVLAAGEIRVPVAAPDGGVAEVSDNLSAGQGFDPPFLPAGTYSYVIQQTGPQISEYVLEFVLTGAPPAASE